MEAAAVREAWARAGAALTDVDAAAWGAAGDRAIARHEVPERRYHGSDHVAAVLRALTALTEPVGVELVAAAVFHDAVYDATQPDNERESARLAAHELGMLGVDQGVVDRVVELIEATETHDLDGLRSVDPETAGVFLDADLSILGAPADVYDAYAVAIRAEYAHVPDADFRTGRAEILARFLQRERLFFTDRAHELWNTQARQNLTRELTTLRGVIREGSDP